MPEKKTKYVVEGVNIDEVIKSIRSITPCNRTGLRNCAVKELIRGKTLKEVALIMKDFNDNKKSEDKFGKEGDEVILE